MYNLKRLCMVLLTIAMLVTLAACGSSDSGSDSSVNPSTETPTAEAITPEATATPEATTTPEAETPTPEATPSEVAAEETPTPTATPAEEQPPVLLDLTGNWIERNSNSKTFYQSAVIQGNTIEVYWIDVEENSQMLYWAGSYTAPPEATQDYAWDSVNDKSKTDSALLASGDDTKTFTYKDGTIRYSVSAMGETTTLELVRQ